MTRNNHRFPGIRLAAAAWVACLGATAGPAAAQQPPALQITAPAGGTVVNPGQTISVTVTSPANTPFAGLAVVGQDPLGLSDIATSLPAQFSFTVPTRIECRTYALTAMGTTPSGQTVESALLLIDVERPDSPRKLAALMPKIYFRVTGETLPITLMGTFPDDAVLELTESSRVAYTSSNQTVATVDKNGIVTAVAPGQASVTASYRLGAETVQLVIPVSVAAQALSPSRFAIPFADQDVGTTSPPQQLTIRNATNGPFNILSIRAGGEFAESDDCPTSAALESNASCTITLTFTPGGAGLRRGTLTIENTATMSPSAIPLTGTGHRRR